MNNRKSRILLDMEQLLTHLAIQIPEYRESEIPWSKVPHGNASVKGYRAFGPWN
jgi:hypothetical protein